jgi:hypothetical protein
MLFKFKVELIVLMGFCVVWCGVLFMIWLWGILGNFCKIGM